MGPTLDTDGRILHTFFARTHSAARPHQQCSASFCPRAALYRFPIASMSGGSSSDWWDGWEWRGEWIDSSSPDPTPITQATDEQAITPSTGYEID